MALRLCGEEFSVVQGLDDCGWLKEIRRSVTGGAVLTLERTGGSGDALQLSGSTKVKGTVSYLDLGTSALLYGYGSLTVQGYGAVVIDSDTSLVDIRKAIRNTGSSGEVAGRVDFQDDVVIGAGKLLRVGTGTTLPSSPAEGDLFYLTDVDQLKLCTVGGATPTWVTVSTS